MGGEGGAAAEARTAVGASNLFAADARTGVGGVAGSAAPPADVAASPPPPNAERIGNWVASGRFATIVRGVGHGAAYDACGRRCVLPLVTPCAHLACTNCVGSCRVGCPACGTAYTLDGAGVPEAFFEMQVAHRQDVWAGEWQRTKSAKGRYLLQRLDEMGVTAAVVGRGRLRPKVIIYTGFDVQLFFIADILKSPRRGQGCHCHPRSRRRCRRPSQRRWR